MSKMLRLRFIGESAIDDGGPQREYFQLLLQEIASLSGFYEGWLDHVLPVHNVTALANNKFYIVGKMVATVLVQGGQLPAYFAGAIADFLCFERVTCLTDIDDIADVEVRSSLQKVC